MQAVKLGSLRSFTQSFFPVNAEIPLLPPTGWWEPYYKLWRVIMSNVLYSLKSKGIRLIDSQKAWIIGKNGRPRLNPRYWFAGKMQISMPNVIVTASDRRKPSYKGCLGELNNVAKWQIVDHFYNDDGKRNSKKIAYFGIDKRAKAFAGGNQKHNKRCYLRVRVSAIKNIGCQRKDRHKWFVGKFHK